MANYKASKLFRIDSGDINLGMKMRYFCYYGKINLILFKTKRDVMTRSVGEISLMLVDLVQRFLMMNL